MSKPEKRETIKNTTFTVSAPLEQALLRSATLVGSEKPVGVSDVLSQILNEEGLAKQSLHMLAKSNFSEDAIQPHLQASKRTREGESSIATLTVKNKSIRVTGSLAALLQEAGKDAQNDGCIDTGHVLSADLQAIDSVMNPILKRITSTSVPVAQVLYQFIHLARQKGTYPRELVADDPIQAERLPMVERTFDAIARAKAGMYADAFINPEWNLTLIQALSVNKVSVLMTEYEEEVMMAIQGLASELGKHEKSYLDLPSVIIPDAVSLVDDPDGTIAEAVVNAKGGVLVLPGDPRYLTHKSVRLAIERNEIRVMSFAHEQSWQKVKSAVDQLDAREVYLSAPPKKTIRAMLQAQKTMMEATYSVTPNGDAPLVFTISEQALDQAATLGYQYAAVIGLPAILSAKRLLDAAAINIKIAHSGVVTSSRKTEVDTSIDVNDIYQSLHTVTGIEIEADNPERYLTMEDELKKDIIGQEEAIDAIADIIRRSKTSMKDPNRPIGTFAFFGPSGVGKTELAKVLNRFLFHDDDSLIEIDMSEYMEKEAVARMIGAPPGYVGYEEGGQLTEKVRKKPYSVIVFDEVEKAHPEVFNALLQLLEAGRLTDGKGRTVDFRNTVIIMTGNIGSSNFEKVETVGFETVRKQVMVEVKQSFRPEFLNRLDEIIVFKTLDKKAMAHIVDLQIAKLNKRFAENEKLTLVLTPEAHTYLETVGYDPQYGARPLRRAVEKYISGPLSKKILKSEFNPGDTITVDYVEESIVFTPNKTE